MRFKATIYFICDVHEKVFILQFFFCNFCKKKFSVEITKNEEACPYHWVVCFV